MGKDLAIGDRAPGFNLPRDGSGSVSLADFKGKKLVLYFYPGNYIRVDTSQTAAFNADIERAILPVEEN